MKSAKQVFVATMILLTLGLSGATRAQEHAYRLSDREMRDLLSRIDKQAERFRGSLKSALNHSRFDDSKTEDRINDFVKGFEQATEHLKHRYTEKRSASTEAEEVLNRAERIDDFMERHHLSPRAESDWGALRASLDELASAYNVTWSWTDRRPR
jgi:hypothetical protein